MFHRVVSLRLRPVLWLGFWLASTGQAEHKKTLIECAFRFKDFVHRLVNPWQIAADQTDVRKFRQRLPLHENFVVAPLWRMQQGLSPLAQLREEVKALKAAGATGIFLPPTYSQMLHDFFGTQNNHGYWSKSFDLQTVDSSLGSPAEYAALRQDLKSLQLAAGLDVNIRHLGYLPAEKQVDLWGQTLHGDDPNFFLQGQSPSLFKVFSTELLGPGLEHNSTNFIMWGLPALNLHNPWVRRNIIADHLVALDLGYRHFRIDAAKHLPIDMIQDFTRALRTKAATLEPVHPPRFVMEYLTENYGEIAYHLGQLGDLPGIYYIDFAMAFAVRRSIVENNSFALIGRTLRARRRAGIDSSFLIQQISDQDGYFGPLYHGDDASAAHTTAVLWLTHMTSDNRPYAVAGMEQAAPRGASRPAPQKFFDPQSPLTDPLKKIHTYFNENFSRLEASSEHDVLQFSKDHLIIRRRFREGTKSLVLILDHSPRGEKTRAVVKSLPPEAFIFKVDQSPPHSLNVYAYEI